MSALFTIRKQVSPRARVALAFVSWGVILLTWVALTHWEILPPFSLPKPLGVVRAFGRLWTEYDLLGNVAKSWWRIAQAFLWCTVIAIPLGIFMAAFRWVFELVNPVAAPMRSMPLTAFLPAFIALFGMDETMKVAFLWFGMFFYLLAVVVEEANRVDNSLLETAYTLGAKRPSCVVADVSRVVSRDFFFVSHSLRYWMDVRDPGGNGELAKRRGLHGGGGAQGVGFRKSICRNFRHWRRGVSISIFADVSGEASVSLATIDFCVGCDGSWSAQRERSPESGEAWKLRSRRLRCATFRSPLWERTEKR